MDIASYDKYMLPDGKEKDLWKDCYFVFDSSALLDFYYYPETTRSAIYSDIFDKIKDKLWIPAQVQYEYFKNREGAIKKPINEKYNPLIDILVSLSTYVEETKKRLKELTERTKNPVKHPYIEQSDIAKFQKTIDKYAKDVNKFKKNITDKIEKQKEEILKLQRNDTVLDSFNEFFKVGNDYSFETIMDITKEGKHRYDFQIPPGYKDDKEKKGMQIFGDLIIWKQLIDFAIEKKSNIVFVCNDLKDDWCILDETSSEKRIKSPRHELLTEFTDKTGRFFWMYSQDEFIHKSNDILGSRITGEQIEQISRIIATKIAGIPELKVIESKYYTDQASCDPTSRLQSLIIHNALNTIANNDLCGDPHYGVQKKLKIKYSLGNEIHEREYNENDPVHLP